MPVRKILLPSALQSGVLQSPRVSTTQLGTAYELLALELLSAHPYYMELIRVGGANDKGIDLRGRWETSLTNLSSSERKNRSRSGSGLFDVIVQCKAERSPLRPSVLREFEGVLQNQALSDFTSSRRPSTPTVGILVSLSGFTKSTIDRSVESRWPISLVHYKIEREKLKLKENGKVDPLQRSLDNAEEDVVSWNKNQAWRELVGDTDD
ncbi:Rrg7p [Sporobolomyces salmoneus]|uniref:Rrg7p n=1 Tax=Sporobolomyces salmoneus TaxID=183962 RepID=UPI00317C9985